MQSCTAACYYCYCDKQINTLWTVLEETDLMWIPVKRSWRLNERHYGALQGIHCVVLLLLTSISVLVDTAHISDLQCSDDTCSLRLHVHTTAVSYCTAVCADCILHRAAITAYRMI
jgi:hypothetical protein